MTELFRPTLRSLGIGELTFGLDPEARRRLLLASALPLSQILILAVDMYINLRFDTYGYIGSSGGDIPDGWARLGVFTFTANQFVAYLALGVLFMMTIRGWTRTEASWMALMGTCLVLLALGFGVAGIGMSAVFNAKDAFELRAFTWGHWAGRFALLSIGYFFVAYRGLSAVEPSMEEGVE